MKSFLGEYWPAVIVCILLGAAWSLKMAQFGAGVVRTEAISAGVAEWTVDPATGKGRVKAGRQRLKQVKVRTKGKR